MVGDQGLLWLLALLVEDAEVVPDFIFKRVKTGGLNDIFETFTIVAILEVNQGETGPVGGFIRVLLGGLHQHVKRTARVVHLNIDATLDVEAVSMIVLDLVGRGQEVERLLVVT